MIAPDSLTADTIEQWLDTHHEGSRKWLASRLGMSVGAVAHGFSSRGFSDKSLSAIAALMEIDELKAAGANTPDDDDSSKISFTTAEFERLERARAAVGSPPRPQFYRDGILRYIDHIEATEGPIEVPKPGDSYVSTAPPHPRIPEEQRPSEDNERKPA